MHGEEMGREREEMGREGEDTGTHRICLHLCSGHVNTNNHMLEKVLPMHTFKLEKGSCVTQVCVCVCVCVQ